MLELRDVDVSYGPVRALRGVSLEVRDGEMVALLGANGAGKTTTLRTISGLLRPEAGEITFDGARIDGQAPFEVIRAGIAHLPEGRELFADLSVLDNLRLGYWTRRNDKHFDARANEVMGFFPILGERAHQAAGTLSGGEQQMLGVARALMPEPRLLIVDELSLGLAPKIVEQLFEILGAVNRRGTAVLLVEQFVNMALAHTSRAYVLTKGSVAVVGDSNELLSSPELLTAYLGETAAAHSDTEPARRRRRAPRSAKAGA